MDWGANLIDVASITFLASCWHHLIIANALPWHDASETLIHKGFTRTSEMFLFNPEVKCCQQICAIFAELEEPLQLY